MISQLDPFGGDVERHHEHAEVEQRGAQVLLEDQDQEAEQPDHEHRAEVAPAREVDAEEPPAGQRQHLALAHQVVGEEDEQRQLGELTGLDREAAEQDPQLGAVDLGDTAPAARAGIITSTMPTRPRVYAYRDSDRWSRTISSSSRPRQDHRGRASSASCRPADAGEDGQARPARSGGAAPRSSRRRKRHPEPVDQGHRRQQHRVGVRAPGTGSPRAGRGRPRRAAAAGTQKSGGDLVQQVRLDGRRVDAATSTIAKQQQGQLGVAPRPCQAYAGRSPAAAGEGAGAAAAVTGGSSAISVDAHSATGSRPGRAPARPVGGRASGVVVGAGGRRWRRRSAADAGRRSRRGARRPVGSAAAVVGAGVGRRGAAVGSSGQSGFRFGLPGVAGQLGQLALGVRLALGRDALLDLSWAAGGEVVQPGVAGRSARWTGRSRRSGPGCPGRPRPGPSSVTPT